MIDGNLYEGPIGVKNVLIICENTYLNVVNAGCELAIAAEEIDFSYSECKIFVTRLFIYSFTLPKHRIERALHRGGARMATIYHVGKQRHPISAIVL